VGDESLACVSGGPLSQSFSQLYLSSYSKILPGFSFLKLLKNFLKAGEAICTNLVSFFP